MSDPYIDPEGVSRRRMRPCRPWHRWSTWSVIERDGALLSEWEVNLSPTRWWARLVTSHAPIPAPPHGCTHRIDYRRSARRHPVT